VKGQGNKYSTTKSFYTFTSCLLCR